MQKTDTIAAIATAPGRGGVGIVRISGPNAKKIAEQFIGHCPPARVAQYRGFLNSEKTLLDNGVALFFEAPNSFTGEDVLELQGHGGPVILDMLLAQALKYGARLARPGEFSERAFLNDKLDLAQAEAIIDLINASSQQAAKNAVNSFTGVFSKKIQVLVESLIHLRMYVESAIDFPEEEIDFLSDGKIATGLSQLLQQSSSVLDQAQQGVLMRDGMKVVIAGRPNAGKSSLLNALSEKDIAIVTDIAGTTRDVLREQIHIDGMPLHIVDTAGLRESPDKVEKIGIERAWQEIDSADRILLIIDTTDQNQLDISNHWPEFLNHPHRKTQLTVLYNKVDQSAFVKPMESTGNPSQWLSLSAKTGQGIEALKDHLKAVMGFSNTAETGFSARRRHLKAIETARDHITNGEHQLQHYAAGELLAEDLRLAQQSLSEITGTYTADDLLGQIFGSFCIGK